MNYKLIPHILIIALIAFFCNQLIAKEKFSGLIILTKGKVQIERSGKKIKAKKNMLVQAGDTITTGSASLTGIQLANGITTNIGSKSRIIIRELLKDGKGRNIKMKVAKGSLMSRVKPGKEVVVMQISSPTLIAAVRGTEFSVESNKDDESTIMVNEGEISVNSAQGDKVKNKSLKAGEKISATFQQVKDGIMNEFEKNKFRMLDNLDRLKNRQFEAYLEQVRRNEELREQMRNKTMPTTGEGE